MKREVEEFLHDSYKILEIMYCRRIPLADGSFKSELSRDTLSELSGFTVWQVKRLINRLVKLEYLERIERKRGQYIITKKTISAVKILK